MGLVHALFPPSSARTTSRAGRVALVLALLVAVFFPKSLPAGTDVAVARWTTAGALAAAGVLLLLSRGRLGLAAAALAALAAGAVAAPAPWLLAYAAIASLYVATSLVPRPAHTAAASAAGTTGAATDDADRDADRDGRPRHEARELVESIATALVLALVVREFAFEAFKIPTGSMEPTILGDSAHGKRIGDRLLAFKAWFSDPPRWSIVVFRWPLYRQTNYIKRLVGLPGEHLEIREGDVYVGRPPRIVSKPDSVQEVMWQRDWESRGRLEDDFDADAAADGSSGWTFDGGVARLAAPAGAAERWMAVRRRFDFHDLRASFDVEELVLDDGGTFLVRVEGAGRPVTLAIAKDAMRLTAPGRDAVDLGLGGAATLPRRFRLGLSCADRIARVHLDGRQVAAVETADESIDSGERSGSFSVGGAGARATLSSFLVEKDIQYSPAGRTTFDIPEDGFVMLGDNTVSSNDSRQWTAHVVVLKDGRTFVAPDKARRDEKRETPTWSPRPDGGVDFVDRDGVERSFSKDEIAEIRRNEQLSYVLREDLIGPAFFVFFPFPPLGEFRPRFLR